MSVRVRFVVDNVALGESPPLLLLLLPPPGYICFHCLYGYHSTNAPHSSSTTCWCYRKDKRAKPGNLPKSNALKKIGEHGMESYFNFCLI